MLSKAIQLSILYLLALHILYLSADVDDVLKVLKPLPGGSLKPGLVVKVSLKKSFYTWHTAINIQEKEKRYEGDIGLHMKFRYKTPALVLDYYTDGEYKEAVWTDIPLESHSGYVAHEYDIRITAMEDHYDIEVAISDNSKSYTFPYKTDISKLKYVEVYGDGGAVKSISFE